MRWLLVPALLVAPLLSCGGLVRPDASLPKGITCARVFVAGADLAAALEGKGSGDCVLAGTGTYVGNFVLPQDVSLIGGDGATVTLRGSTKGQPVLSVKGGAKTLIRGLHIDTSAGGGIAIDPGPVAMSGVTITGADEAALSVRCAEADCDQRAVTVEDCEFTRNHLGLVAIGAQVRVTRGRIADGLGSSASDGTGVLATGGAVLSLDGVAVENNANVGILIDGATSRFTGQGLTVSGNQGRGLWGQGLRGAQAWQLSGSTIARNHLVGLGLVDSEGVTVTDTTVAETVTVPLPTGLGTPPMVGDGVGLFGGSRGVRLERLTLSQNGRAQVLVDRGAGGLELIDPVLTAPAGGFRVVVQHSDAGVVTAPAGVVDAPPSPLAFDAPVMAVPR